MTVRNFCCIQGSVSPWEGFMSDHKIEFSARKTIRKVIDKSFRRYVYSRDNNKDAFLTEDCSVSYELRTIMRKPHSSRNYDNVSV